MIQIFFGENFLIKKEIEKIFEKKKVKIFDFEEKTLKDLEKEAFCENLFEKKDKIFVLKNFEENEDFKKNFLEKKEKFQNTKTLFIFWFKEKPKKDQFFEELKKIAKIKEFKNILKFWELEKWVENEFLKLGFKIEPLAKKELIERVGNNLWQIEQEIKKLAAFKRKGIIKKEDVESLVVLNLKENVFEILNLILENKKKKAFLLLEDLVEKGENQIKLFSLFKKQLKNLILLKELSEKKLSFYEISQKTGFHLYFIQKNWVLIQKWKKEDLLKLYSQIFKYTILAKSGKIEPMLGFSFCFLEV
jgi:DNA polymerase-3 subunit delta